MQARDILERILELLKNNDMVEDVWIREDYNAVVGYALYPTGPRTYIDVSFAIRVDDNGKIDYSTVVVGYDFDDMGMISEAKKKVGEMIEEIIKQVSGDM